MCFWIAELHQKVEGMYWAPDLAPGRPVVHVADSPWDSLDNSQLD
jgi:hypothetical protein